MQGEWWRLWTAHFTHFKYSQLVINSAVMAVMGIIAGRFAKTWQIARVFLIAMPIMTGLLLATSPQLLFYRGATGIAAMMWMLATWFLIGESKRFSLGFWLGSFLLLLFAAKAGVACFNGLHQLHLTKTGDNPQYRGPYANKPNRTNLYRQNCVYV